MFLSVYRTAILIASWFSTFSMPRKRGMHSRCEFRLKVTPALRFLQMQFIQTEKQV